MLYIYTKCTCKTELFKNLIHTDYNIATIVWPFEAGFLG
jgi:hypothetical protein